MTQGSRGRRRGEVFGVRLTALERERLEAARDDCAGPSALGPFLLWAAQEAIAAGVLPVQALGDGAPPRSVGVVPPRADDLGTGVVPPRAEERLILDLCGGTGAWSAPYERSGYRVENWTLPEIDVCAVQEVPPAWGVLAAPPCTEFSLAKNGRERDLETALETVVACLKIIALARPKWWALENPPGLLGRWMGTPQLTFEPYEFGDPWTKRTAIWGDFFVPRKGPFVRPLGSAMDRATAEERSITPPGFAEAFFGANV